MFNSVAFAQSDARYLKQNEPAPFTGYLITPDKAESVRVMKIELDSEKKINSLLLDEQKIYEQRLNLSKDHVESLSKQLADRGNNPTLLVIGGFTVGAVITGLVAYGVARSIR